MFCVTTRSKNIFFHEIKLGKFVFQCKDTRIYPISYLWEGHFSKMQAIFPGERFHKSTIIEENSYFSDFSGRFFYVLNLLTTISLGGE